MGRVSCSPCVPPATGLEALQPRHHPEHRAGGGRRAGHPGAVLRPGEDVFPQHPLLRRGQERGAEGLPQHDRGFVRLQIVRFRSNIHTCGPKKSR